MTPDAVLVADSIGKHFGRRRVLSAASLWARSGTITAVLGRNGAGKSTLIRIAAGWLRPDYGIVMYAGRRAARLRLATLARRGLFYLPDRSLLCAYRTIDQHLEALARAFPGAPVAEARATYRLHDWSHRKPGQLSGGERRRAEAALAWARRPVCLLADEPYRGIAPRDQELLTEGLRAMAERGTAVVVTGHEVPVLLDAADDVVWVTAGTTHALGPPPVARRHFQFAREYLGPSGWADGATAAV